jgi:hypothetical protein
MLYAKTKTPIRAGFFLFLIACLLYAYLIFFDIIHDLKWFGGADFWGGRGNIPRAFYIVTFVFSVCANLLFKRMMLPNAVFSVGTFLALCLLAFGAFRLGHYLNVSVYESVKAEYLTEWKDTAFWIYGIPFFVIWAAGWGLTMLVAVFQRFLTRP